MKKNDAISLPTAIVFVILARISGEFPALNMFRDKKIVVVMPAYNAARTLVQTYEEVMEQGVVDLVIIVDDASRDDTSTIAKKLPNTIVFTHNEKSGLWWKSKELLPPGTPGRGVTLLLWSTRIPSTLPN